MLADIAPAIVVSVVVLHAPLQLKMVVALKVRVLGRPGVVLLYVQHGSEDGYLGNPMLKFGYVEQGESKFFLHKNSFLRLNKGQM